MISQKFPKLIKRFLILIIVIKAMTSTSIASEIEPELKSFSYQDYEYTLNDLGQATIVKYLGEAKELFIPKELEGYQVVAIGEEAFIRSKNLVTLSLPEGIKRLGSRSFAVCKNLANIHLPEGLEEIGDEAFSYLGTYKGPLKRIALKLPDSLRALGANPFMASPIYIELNSEHPCLALTQEGILFDKLDKRLIYYPYYSFDQAIDLPEDIKIIGAYAFAFCEFIESIKLPEDLKTIEEGAFYVCFDLKHINFPQSLTLIDSYAFYACSLLKVKRLPLNLTYIGESAFNSCDKISKIYIPKAIQYIGEEAFDDHVRIIFYN